MPYKKGQSGNIAGRPKGTFTQKRLILAIKKVERDHPELPKFLEDTILRSYTDSTLRKALLDKLIPSLKSIEGVLKGEGGFSNVSVYLTHVDGTVEKLGADNSGDNHGDGK